MKIVHMEDDGPLRDILKTALTSFDPDITMLQFADSDQAMQYIDQHKDEVDLFILDLRVPGKLDGMGVAKAIRNLQYDGGIVITSAYRPPEKASLNELSCTWVQKPWHILEAASVILPLGYKRVGKHWQS